MTVGPIEVLEAGVPGAFPSAVALGTARGSVVVSHAVGDAPGGVDTVYDLASLTKPMAVGTLLMWAVAEGWIELEEDVFGVASVAALAGHVSGLPAHRHYWRDGASPEEIRARVLAEPKVGPVGQAIYSDLGYMLLGWFLEERLGSPLDRLFERVVGAFGLGDTGFGPRVDGAGLAPTEDCPWRGRTLRGEVHDQNAWALGGVAGHAGLFGTARDVHRWAAGILDAWHSRSDVVDPGTLRRFLRPQSGTTWQLGFDGISSSGSSTGSSFGPNGFGHLGFTGTSVWVEPDREWVVTLLSNRVHPIDHAEPAIKRLRPRFHDAFAWAASVEDGSETR